MAKNGLCEPYLLQTSSSFPLRLSESQRMFNLGQICQNLNANLPSSNCSLFFDKARCFSQSECALYGNFIIMNCIVLLSIAIIIIIIIIIQKNFIGSMEIYVKMIKNQNSDDHHLVQLSLK